MKWRTAKKCANCPFASSGPGLRLRKSLAKGRWRSILDGLRKQNHFSCHETTPETGNGTNLVCAGSIEWQEKHNCRAQLVQVMQRMEYFKQVPKPAGLSSK
jgi:hypothetical protein